MNQSQGLKFLGFAIIALALIFSAVEVGKDLWPDCGSVINPTDFNRTNYSEKGTYAYDSRQRTIQDYEKCDAAMTDRRIMLGIIGGIGLLVIAGSTFASGGSKSKAAPTSYKTKNVLKPKNTPTEPVRETTESKNFCSACGKKIDPDDSFCSGCGAAI